MSKMQVCIIDQKTQVIQNVMNVILQILNLRDQLSKFSINNMVFIWVDFNRRKGTQKNFIIENEKDLNYLPREHELDTITLVRNNQGTLVNEYGQQLLQLCIETKLKILNGRHF